MPSPTKLPLNEREPGRTNKASIFQQLAPGARLYDSEIVGLFLQAGQRARTWHIVSQSGQTQVRRSLGRAKTSADALKGLNVEQARAAAAQVVEAVAAGIPVEAAKKRAERAAAQAAASTFEGVADEYFAMPREQGGGANLRSLAEARRKVKTDLADWVTRPIGSITRREIRDLLREKAKASPSSANRLQSLISRIFRFAVAEELLESLPVVALGKAPEPTKRERHLSREEIRLVWAAAGEMPVYGPIVRLLLTTGLRRNEIGALRRSEIGPLTYRELDPRTGREKTVEALAIKLAPARMKNGKQHTLPLSWLAKRLIDEVPRPQDDDGEELEFDHLFATGRRGDTPPSGWSRWKQELDGCVGRLIAEERGEPYDVEKHRLDEPWHVHDLRRSTATLLSMPPLSVDERTISRILAHAQGGGITSKYLAHSYNPECARALNRLADELAKIVGENVKRPNFRRGA